MGRKTARNPKDGRGVAFRTTAEFDSRLDACVARASKRAGVDIKPNQWIESAIMREIERDEVGAEPAGDATGNPRKPRRG